MPAAVQGRRGRQASSGGGGGGTLSSGTVGGGAQVDSKIAESGQAASTTRKGSDGKSRRTQEQLRRVFDRYAGKFNSQYQRALRSNLPCKVPWYSTW